MDADVNVEGGFELESLVALGVIATKCFFS